MNRRNVSRPRAIAVAATLDASLAAWLAAILALAAASALLR